MCTCALHLATCPVSVPCVCQRTRTSACVQPHACVFTSASAAMYLSVYACTSWCTCECLCATQRVCRRACTTRISCLLTFASAGVPTCAPLYVCTCAPTHVCDGSYMPRDNRWASAEAIGEAVAELTSGRVRRRAPLIVKSFAVEVRDDRVCVFGGAWVVSSVFLALWRWGLGAKWLQWACT